MVPIDEVQLRDKVFELVTLKDVLSRTDCEHPGVLAAVSLRVAHKCLEQLFWKDTAAFVLQLMPAGAAVSIGGEPLPLPQLATTLFEEEHLDPQDYIRFLWPELPQAVTRALEIILQPAQKLEAIAEMIDDETARVEIICLGARIGHKKPNPKK